MKPVLLIGPFPPPVNGFAVITEALAQSLEQHGPVERFNTVPRSGRRWPKGLYHLRRAGRVLASLTRILAVRQRGTGAVYLGCNDGLGMIYALVQIAVLRCLGLRGLLHHHSYKYLQRRSIVMRCILGVGGRHLHHIFLSQGMAAGFSETYGTVTAQVLENAAFVPPAPFLPRPDNKSTFTLGMLSNLSAEKGLYEFLRLIETAATRDLPLQGVLAGPARGADLAAIRAAEARLGSRLTYLGPVYGDAKAGFYRSIDLFVFPTNYRTEAQPTVIFEAQSHGRPAIARARGAIAEQVDHPDHAIPLKADFTEAVLQIVARRSGDIRAWQAMTHANYIERHHKAQAMLGPIARTLAGDGDGQIGYAWHI